MKRTARMNHLIEVDELRTLGRPIGKHVSEDKLLAYITEVEQMSIKPSLGEALFRSLLDEGTDNEDYRILLNGGSYEDECGNVSLFMGLKVAISYFVYAQNVMTGDFESTRYGMVIKDGDYSTRISSKERSDCYNNTLEVANYYLAECVKYCKVKKLIKSKTNPSVVSTGGMTIRKIG